MKTLIVEDEKDIALFIKKGLESERFNVDVADNGKKGESMASMNGYDLIILDHNLPEKNGIDICASLRENGTETPIIMLTAEQEISQKVKAFDCGANDYVTKPFAIEELVARARVLLRDNSEAANSSILEHDDLTVDLNKFIVRKDDEILTLRKKEFILLEYFLRNPDAILTRSMILEKVWDTNADPFTNTVDVHVRRLRKSLDSENPDKYIETIRGVGYRLKKK